MRACNIEKAGDHFLNKLILRNLADRLTHVKNKIIPYVYQA